MNDEMFESKQLTNNEGMHSCLGAVMRNPFHDFVLHRLVPPWGKLGVCNHLEERDKYLT
jgi:hypothetical protein